MSVPIPLKSGAYQASSLIANAQRAINVIAEQNPENTAPEMPVTHYPIAGNRPLSSPPNLGRGRGVFRSTVGVGGSKEGNLYSVVDTAVYYIDPNWNHTLIGNTLTPGSTPTSLADNGVNAVLVDGSPNGYSIDIKAAQAPAAFAQIGDPNFYGADRTDYLDTFLIFNQPGQNNFYISLTNSTSFDALNIAAKGSFPDPLQTVVVTQRVLWLPGTLASEPWFDSGSPIFPFEETPGQVVPYGLVAKYSVATADDNAFWLSQNKDGQAIALMVNGYKAKRISTFALEREWRGYPLKSDAIAYTYQQNGHTFYVIHFPSADKSWGYDLATDQWHQRCSVDNNGVLHRERVCYHAFAYGTNVAQDWQTGQLYAFDPDVYTDNTQPIVCIRSFPHFVAELKEVTHVSFVADIETGTQPNTGETQQALSPFSSGFSSGFGPIVNSPAPQVAMRYSNDGGYTWSNYRPKGFVSSGRYRSMMRWRGLGMARDRVYELLWVAAASKALQGAFIDPIQHSA